MSTQASKGAAALDRKDFPSTIKYYTSALSEFPTSPDYYIKRSTAYQRSSPPEYERALQDAEMAVHHAHKRGKRELIATAQMRRGIALFGLKRWAEADKCFEWVKMRNGKEAGLELWRKKLEVEVSKAGEVKVDAEVSLMEIPEGPSISIIDDIKEKAEASNTSANQMEADVPDRPEGKNAVEVVQTPANKIRHEWYQTSDTVVVTLLAKGVPKEQAIIDIRDRSVCIQFYLLV